MIRVGGWSTAYGEGRDPDESLTPRQLRRLQQVALERELRRLGFIMSTPKWPKKIKSVELIKSARCCEDKTVEEFLRGPDGDAFVAGLRDARDVPDDVDFLVVVEAGVAWGLRPLTAEGGIFFEEVTGADHLTPFKVYSEKITPVEPKLRVLARCGFHVFILGDVAT